MLRLFTLPNRLVESADGRAVGREEHMFFVSAVVPPET